VSFAVVTTCVASQQVFIIIVYFVIDSVRKILDTPSYYSVLDVDFLLVLKSPPRYSSG
jgi:hypothetical protein